MKKIFTTIAALAFMGSVSFAQNAKTVTTHSHKAKTETKTGNGTETKAETKTETKHLKKDGTPDRRYKENKVKHTTKTETKTTTNK